MNILSVTAKKVVDVATFIQENTSAGKLRYTTEADTTHRVYFPTRDDGEGHNIPYILAAPVHTWGEGSSFSSCICLKGVASEDGVYDGGCPVCDRLTDASDIVKYIKAEKEMTCGLTGDARKKFLEDLDKEVWKSRKVSYPRIKYYVALALLRCDKDGRALIDGDGPKFSIHIAAWTEGFVKKLMDALELQDEAPTLGAREFKLKYPDYPDAMSRVGQCHVSFVDDKKMVAKPGTPLFEAIAREMERFDFERAVSLARPEAQEKTPNELKRDMDVLFREWDDYKARLAVDPNAKYLEYAGNTAIAESSASPVTPAVGDVSTDVSLSDLDEALFGLG
jgi:hypothetical protein